MPIYRLQQTIATADNVAANYATNTWHFTADDDAVIPTIQTAIQAFYNNIRPNLSSLVRTSNHPYKWYDIADPEPRAPIVEGTWNFTAAPSGTGLPPEVSLCISFQGNKVSGEPQARRRGRLFIPFLTTASSGTDGRPTSSVIAQLVSGGQTLLNASEAAADWNWIVLTTTEANSGAIISNGWVDNEWDTQRRRGRVPTSRSLFN